jgi:hypothetical protein
VTQAFLQTILTWLAYVFQPPLTLAQQNLLKYLLNWLMSAFPSSPAGDSTGMDVLINDPVKK